MISFAISIQQLLEKIIPSPDLHARWLNTLSFLENSGARGIAACEHPTLVKEEMLKHAAEEFRHAHHLKRQISKISEKDFSTYSTILGGTATRHYLPALNAKVCRYLHSNGFYCKEAAYLLVTYAIERRAQELYPIYEGLLRQTGSRVSVKSILLEESEHLQDVCEAIRQLPSGFLHAQHVSSIESELCRHWLQKLQRVL